MNRSNLAARGYGPSHIAAALQKLELATDATGITLAILEGSGTALRPPHGAAVSAMVRVMKATR